MARRAVIVGQIQMRDAQVKRAARDGTAVFKGVSPAEVMPEAERQQWQLEARLAAAAVEKYIIVTGRGWRIHDLIVSSF